MNSPLNIVQVCLSKSWGGLEMTALEQTEWLLRKGHRVLNLTRAESPLKQKLTAMGAPVLEFRGLRNSLKIRKEVLGFGPDLVVHQQLRDLTFHRLFFKRGTPSLGLLHIFLKVRKFDPWHRFHYSQLNRLVVLTEAQKANALAHLPLKEQQLVVVPNGVDLKRFHPRQRDPALKQSLGFDPSVFLVGVVGRFDPQKGQLESLVALKNLCPEFPQLRMIFVGEDTVNSPGTRAQLLQYIRLHQLQDLVQVLPFQENIPSLMASLDLFMMPSYGETFGRVLIEAMASGVPVLGTRAGGVVSLIHEGVDGLLVEPRSPEALSEILREILCGKHDLNSYRENALQKVSNHFDVEKVQDQLLKLYLQTAAQKP